MNKSNITEVEFQLRKLITKYSGLFAYHQWPSEQERWIELIFALVARISKKPEPEVREAIEFLDNLGLLDVKELSNIPKVENNLDMSTPLSKRIVEFLSESGFTEEDSKRNLLVMHEAAKSLIKHHDGKVQKYLRKYGQLMVNEISDSFSFSEMNEKDVKYAITYWLQNVLNMPLHLKTESTEKFCEEYQTTNEDLVKEADTLDINIALLDDMIDQYMLTKKGIN